jgi:uncharacterized membrane protein YgcG
MAMNAAQVQQLIQGVVNGIIPAPGGGAGAADMRDLKAPTFDWSKRGAESWIAFKEAWLAVKNLRGWNWLIARQRLHAAMREDAMNAVRRINSGECPDDVQKRNAICDAAAIADNDAAREAYLPIQKYRFERLMKAYEAVFLAEAGSDLARTEFAVARQREKESIQDWHTRLVMLYQRAEPTADLNTTAELLHAFINGMSHPIVVERVTDAHPATMEEALKVATSKWATILNMRELAKIRPGFARSGCNFMGIASMQENAPKGKGNAGAVNEGNNTLGNVRCYGCGAFGHLKRDCRQKKKTGNSNQQHLDRGEGGANASPQGGGATRGGGFRGGRGNRRGGGRGGGNNTQRRGINSMEKEKEAEGEDKDPAPSYEDAVSGN